MITQNEIVDALKELISGKYTGEIVYEEMAPNNFQRPSFLIETTGTRPEQITQNTVEMTLGIRVSCFVETDVYHNSHFRELTLREYGVMGLLLVGYIKVGDRVLLVDNVLGNLAGFDYATVTASIRWAVDLDELRNIEVPPLMENYTLKVEGKIKEE